MSTSAWKAAVTRIESAQRDGAEELDLHGLGLKGVPPLPPALGSLRGLDLSGNRLAELPSVLWDLDHLERLDVGNNRLTTLDPAIGGLGQLEDLDASENRLTELPAELAQCVRLRRLALCKNRLADIGPAAGLPSLEVLDVSRNRLQSLPRLRSARTLEALDLSHNQISSLAPWSHDLRSLRRLDLAGNRLTEVADLASLKLHELFLDENRLEEPPSELASVKSLRVLSAQKNPFGDLPEAFDRVSRVGDRRRARAAIARHTSGGPRPVGNLKAAPYSLDLSLHSRGVKGASELIDVYYKRFDACCPARLTFPDGSRVQLDSVSRKSALAAVDEHLEALAAGGTSLDFGSAASVTGRDTMAELVEAAVVRLPQSALVPDSEDDELVVFSADAAGVESAVSHAMPPEPAAPAVAPPMPPEPAAAAVVSRYLQATHPEEVEPQQVFSVSVALRRMLSQGEAGTPLDMKATVDVHGQPTGAPPLVVRLHPSSAFEVIGPRRYEMAVPIEADTPPQVFQLRAVAQAKGPQEIDLTLHQAYEVLGQLRLIIKVMPAARAELHTATYQRLRRPWDSGEIAPPDAVLVIHRTRCNDCDRLEYSYEWVARQWPLTEAGSVDLQSSVADTAAAQYQQLSQFARAEGTAEKLAKIGENLYWDITTAALRDFFAQFLPTGQSLLVYTNDPWIPWEIVKPWGGGLATEYSDFLCSRLDMARWYYSSEGQKPAAVVEAHRLALIAAGGSLPAVAQECQYLAGIPVVWPPIQLVAPSPTTSSEIVDLLSSGAANWVHFATHGIQQSDGVGVAMLSVGGELFSLDDLVGPDLEQGLRRSAPLIVMNACHSAQAQSTFVHTEGWAERFLELGSSAFIGANWEVTDDLACRFACALYDLLRKDHEIGAAVRGARNAIRQVAPGNSTWLAYSLYAHPRAIVTAG